MSSKNTAVQGFFANHSGSKGPKITEFPADFPVSKGLEDWFVCTQRGGRRGFAVDLAWRDAEIASGVLHDDYSVRDALSAFAF